MSLYIETMWSWTGINKMPSRTEESIETHTLLQGILIYERDSTAEQ